MAGTLIADEIKSGTAAPPVVKNTGGAVIGEFCRARANISATTAPASLRDSFNVSSLTDNGTGDITVTFISAMVNVNYTTVSGATKNTDDVTTSGAAVSSMPSQALRTTATQRIITGYSATTFVDCPGVYAAVFGG